MKKFLKILIRYTLKNRKKFSLFFLVLLFILLLFLYVSYSLGKFAEAYDEYELNAREYSGAAFLPSSSGNPLRQEINRTLSEVLSEDFSTSDRLKSAKRGIELLKSAEVQIDRIGETGETVGVDISNMEDRAGRVGNILSRAKTNKIIGLAKEQSGIISDIRGLSYRANYHTLEIFNRIIKDGGELTESHIIELNKQIPKVEEQFDRRSNLYTELESIQNKIETARSELDGMF